jgi:hypothetical protein
MDRGILTTQRTNHEKCSTILNDLPANGRRTVSEVDRFNAALAWMVIGIKTENQSPVQRLKQAWLLCDKILALQQSQQAPDRRNVPGPLQKHHCKRLEAPQYKAEIVTISFPFR